MIAHTCLYCQENLTGRSDKKFCNAQCKSAYHNQADSTSEAYIKNINKQLRCNRRAMRTACPEGKATIQKEFLKTLGMDFKHITHTWKSKGGNLYFFCYDYGYSPAFEENKVMVIQQQDYMK